MRAARLEESVTIAAAPERVFAWADDPANTGWHMRRRSLVMLGVARVTRCGGLLAMALLAGACARPAVVVTAPGPGVPAISALTVTPAHVESGCPLRFRIQFEDSGRDVVRAVARWRAKTGYQRFHEGTDILPFAPEQLQGRSGGRVEVVVIPPHAGSYVYRVQLEDAQGQTSNVAEARVHVEIRPFWRRPACETPGDDTERVRRPNVQPPVVAVLTVEADESVTFVNRSGRVVHLDFLGRADEHHVFQVPGRIRATFHRAGRHPYVVHFETAPRAGLQGVVEVREPESPRSQLPVCGGVSVGEICLER